MNVTVPARTIQRRIFGRSVEIPDIVELPLSTSQAAGADPAIQEPVNLRVTVGVLPDADRVFELDSAVVLHVATGHVAVEPLIDLGPRALEHYIVDHAIPNGLTYGGDMIIHAAGLERNGKAVVLLGDSGRGKSTLSLNLASAGWNLLGDDSIRLELRGDRLWAWPSYPGLRVHPDVAAACEMSGTLVAEYGNKLRVNVGDAHGSDPVELACICALGEDAAFDISNMGPVERCSELVQQLFLPPEPTERSAGRFDVVTPFAEAVDGVRLTYERNAAGTSRVIAALNELIT